MDAAWEQKLTGCNCRLQQVLNAEHVEQEACMQHAAGVHTHCLVACHEHVNLIQHDDGAVVPPFAGTTAADAKALHQRLARPAPAAPSAAQHHMSAQHQAVFSRHF